MPRASFFCITGRFSGPVYLLLPVQEARVMVHSPMS